MDGAVLPWYIMGRVGGDCGGGFRCWIVMRRTLGVVSSKSFNIERTDDSLGPHSSLVHSPFLVVVVARSFFPLLQELY